MVTYDEKVKLAKEWAKVWNVKGKAGGWIYQMDTDTAIVQGWYSLYLALRWLKIISPNGFLDSDYYASPETLRVAYQRAVMYQEIFGRYL